jgi:hypothetical protein
MISSILLCFWAIKEPINSGPQINTTVLRDRFLIIAECFSLNEKLLQKNTPIGISQKCYFLKEVVEISVP